MNRDSFFDLLASLPAPGSWQAMAVDVTLRTTLALIAAAIVGAGLRRASASVRHLAWASALTGAIALPFLSLALPPWQIPIMSQVEPAPVLSTGEQLEMPLRIPLAGRAANPRKLEPRRSSVEPVALRATTPGSMNAAPASARSEPWNWAAWIAGAWSVGVVVVILPLLAGQLRVRSLGKRAARSSDGSLSEAASRLGIRLCNSRPIAVLRGDDKSSPMTWGVLRPVVLLPAGAECWPHDRLCAVLMHELAHVKRWDCLTQLLARLTCAVYWFHPLVWAAAHRLRVESERACDDLVIQAGAKATDYADCLLDVARSLRVSPGLSAVVVPMARASQLEGRLRAILDRSRSRRAVTRRGVGLLLIAVAAVLLPLSAARLGIRVVSAAGAEQGGGRPARTAVMSVSGRVLDRNGQPILGAKVAIVGRRKLAMLNARAEPQHEMMGRAESAADGRFRLTVKRTSSVTHYELQAVASLSGFGTGWADLNRDAEAPTADVQLGAEQPIEGRLVDLQGAPAAGVRLRVSSISVEREDLGRSDGLTFWEATPQGLDDVWPAPIVTGPEGRFRLAGIGRTVRVGLKLDDSRFAQQGLSVRTDATEGTKQVTLAVQPALHVSGRVTCADTGDPLIDALVVVGSGSSVFNSSGAHYRTDSDGRYEANPAQRKYVKVTVYPPVGSPYLIFERNFEGNDDAAKREVDLKVPRGVLLTGRVTERGSGRSLAGAGVFYENGHGNVVEGKGTIPGWMSAVATNSEGRYSIAVTPGKGQLRLYGPTADFVHEVQGDRKFPDDKPGGKRNYAHAFVPYDVMKGQGPVSIDVALKPGVKVAGHVVGPDGQPVEKAEIITTLSISPFHTTWRGDFTLPVREGRFELHGVSPDHPVKCSFLDSKNGWGATLEVTAAMAADESLTVKLQPCGTAKARFLDELDRPVSRRSMSLSIIGTDGPGNDYDDDSLTEEERTMLSADEEIYANVDRLNYWQGPLSDREGRVTLPKLIPGATYRIYEIPHGKPTDAYRWRDFTVEAGRTTDLGDVRVKTEGR